MKKIESNNHSIWIGKNSLSKIDLEKYSKIAILVDENTHKDCLPILLERKNQLKESIVITIKSGEENKNLSNCNNIWSTLSSNHFDRNSLLINLGGGVIGDIGGFCASVYKRGINFIHIPTSLLAMVDASIGGKVGVNFEKLKNQLGFFTMPEDVLIDPVFLNTLPKQHLRYGFAEVIKHALISDKELWKLILDTNFDNLEWENIIEHSVRLKSEIVNTDPFEKNVRKKLNFGHTYAHAIESFYLAKGNPISHGEAVYMGIMLEAEISNISEAEKREVKNYILSNFELPHLPLKSNLVVFLKNDKKNSNAHVNFSLLNGIGKCTIDNLFLYNEL